MRQTQSGQTEGNSKPITLSLNSSDHVFGHYGHKPDANEQETVDIQANSEGL